MQIHRIAPLIALVTLACAFPAQALPDVWKLPSVPLQPAQLPRLAQAPTLDGDLREWSEAARMRIDCAADLLHPSSQHPWQGRDDLSMDVFLGWTDEGLAVAARVRDQDVIHTAADPARFALQDSFELLLDGRSGADFQRSALGPGVLQLLFRAPNQAGESALHSRYGADKVRVRFAARRLPDGYALEALIPWSAFPGFEPRVGALLGAQFIVNDVDARDGPSGQPRRMTGLGAQRLHTSPHRFLPWRLVERIRLEPGAELSNLAVLESPALQSSRKPIPVALSIDPALNKLAVAGEFRLRNSRGRVVQRRTWRMDGSTVSGTLRCPRDGAYLIEAVLRTTDGQTVGQIQRPLAVAARLFDEAAERLDSARLQLLVHMKPQRAAQWMAVGATLERLKRTWVLNDAKGVAHWARELSARFTALDGVAWGSRDVLNLVNLARAGKVVTTDVLWPPAELAVEIHGTEGWVLFFWGSIPLVSVHVTDAPTETAAQQAVREFLAQSRAPGEGAWAAARGRRVFRANHPCPAAAKKAVALVAARGPVHRADVDAIRRDIVAFLAARPASTSGMKLPDGLSVFTGDVGAHTFYSDGAYSPIEVALQAMYSRMDFLVISDRHTLAGAQAANRLLTLNGFVFPVITGQEVVAQRVRLKAYPIRTLIPWDVPLSAMIERAQEQGSAVQGDSRDFDADGMADAEFDAWEHRHPAKMEGQRAQAPRTVVGTSDSRHGLFGQGERTLVLARDPSGAAVAEAVRAGRVAAYIGASPDLYVGPPEVVARIHAALSEPDEAPAARIARWRRTLQRADLTGLLRASPAHPTATTP